MADSRHLMALSIPIAATQLAQVALTTTNTAMLGLIDTAALAAGGLAFVLFNQVRTMGVGLLTVGNQIAAVNAGGAPDRHEQIVELVRGSFVLATVIGIIGMAVLMALGVAAGGLGQDPTTVAAARRLMMALAPGLLPCFWFQVVRQCAFGLRRPQALLWITIASIGVNAALNWMFIHGTWGIPALGITGIGLATTVVYLLSFLALYGVARRDPILAPILSMPLWRARSVTVWTLLRFGFPIAATYGSEAGFFSVVALIIGTFGASALAAHTVVNQLVMIVFQVSLGLSHAASISVSAEIARGGYERASQVARLTLIHGAIAMSVAALVYLLVPELVLRFFIDADDEQTLALASSLLCVAAVLQYFDCAQNVGVGLMRGLHDTHTGFRMTVVGYWIVGVPAAWSIGHIVGGPVGVWLGLLWGLAVTAGLLLHRFNAALSSRTALQAEHSVR